jgi:nitroreductase
MTSGADAPDSKAMQEILARAYAAPSGDNLQPWVLEWQDETLFVSIDRIRDRSLYNFRYRASLIALGTMLENMAIAARRHGLDCDVALNADGEDLLSATVRFRRATVTTPDALYAYIDERCTNRRAYTRTPLKDGVLDALLRSIPNDGMSALTFVQDTARKRVLARATSLNDRFLLEWKPLHDGLFEAVRWTAQEAERTRDGLFVKTLELAEAALAFKIMRTWGGARVLSLLGGKLVAPVHSYQTFMRSAAFGFLQMTGDSREAFVEGGRRLQRVWLTATSLGVSFQPMAGTLYLLQHLDEPSSLPSEDVRRRLIEARRVFEETLPMREGSAPILLFRLGYGPRPSARSLRRLPRLS